MLHKNTGAQDLAHFSVGRTPALWDACEQKHKDSDIPTGYGIEILIGSALFSPECNKYKHLSPLEAELISQCLHHIILFISIHPQNGNNCIVQVSSSNIVSLNDPKNTNTLSCAHPNTYNVANQHSILCNFANTHTHTHAQSARQQ